MQWAQQVKTYGSLIKFSHSVFALPFALISVVFASWEWTGSETLLSQILWIVVAMVSARSAAMGFNRLVDAPLDGQNPRTAQRELPAGLISRQAVSVLILISSGIFIVAAWQLNPLCFFLSPVALLIIFMYSFTKRFTWLAHLILGLGIGLAPVGAWLAITGSFSLVSIVLGLAVMVWIAGFDIIYACQDIHFDRSAGLFSIPARFGPDQALLLAKFLHVMMVLLLLLAGLLSPAGPIYYLGVVTVGVLLIIEHRLVNPGDFSKIHMAFFQINSAIALVLMVFVLVDRFVS